MSRGTRIPRAEAAAKIAPLLEHLRPAVLSGEIAGSYRREKATIGDLEAVFIPSPQFHAHLDKLDAQGMITRGRAWGEKQRQFIYDGLQVDLYTANEDNYGYILWLRTGSAEANHRVVAFAKNKINPSPFRLEGGFAWYETNKLHIPDEATFFRLLGIPFVPPKEREPDTYARLFKSAMSHRWGNPAPLVKVESVAQGGMFEFAPATDAYDRGVRYAPTDEERAQGRRLMHGCPQPQDAPRIREILKDYHRALKATHLGFMEDYYQKQIVKHEGFLQEIGHAS